MADNNNPPGLVLEPELQAKLDGLDDHLEPITKDLNEKAEDEKDTPSEDKKDSEVDEKEEQTDEDKGSEDESEEEEPEDEGYAIDEDGEDKDELEPRTPTDKTPEKSQLSPEQQYIIDNLQPITVRGVVGTDEKVQEFKVYSPEQLPQGFKYIDDRDLSTANKAFSMLENKAVELQSNYRNQETQKSAKAFKENEDNADRVDIGRLQREGDLPKFKLQPDDPKFAEDPASKVIQAILDFKDKKNEHYLEEANAGRPYKHIGFEEAFYMYRRENPTDNPVQKKEDAERKEIAKRTAGTSGSSNTPKKPTVHSGMNSLDLERLIEDKTRDW